MPCPETPGLASNQLQHHRLALAVEGEVLKADAGEQVHGHPKVGGHVLLAVGVAAQGDDPPPQLVVPLEDPCHRDGLAQPLAVAGGVHLQPLAGIHQPAQRLLDQLLKGGKVNGDAVFAPDVPLRVAQVGHDVKIPPHRHVVDRLEVVPQNVRYPHRRVVKVHLRDVQAGAGAVDRAQDDVKAALPEDCLRHVGGGLALAQLDALGDAQAVFVRLLAGGELPEGLLDLLAVAFFHHIAVVVVGDGHPHHPVVQGVGADLPDAVPGVEGVGGVHMAVKQVQLHPDFIPQENKFLPQGGGRPANDGQNTPFRHFGRSARRDQRTYCITKAGCCTLYFAVFPQKIFWPPG